VPEPDLVALFAGPLHRSGARYLVAGSVGAMVYKHFRGMTKAGGHVAEG